MKRILSMMVVALLAVSLGAAPATSPAFTSSFTKPPAAALKALKVAVGKPVKTGFVFVDGRYLPPPYTVERYGTVLRINGTIVSSEVVPWGEFVKTQTGATVSKSEAAPAEETPVAEPEPEPEPEPEEEEVDDSDSSLDDLFDDNPAPKKKKPAAKKRTASRPKPKKPAVTVSYSFDGEFVPNEKTKAYLEKINQARTRIDKQLRAGGYYFFGSRYASITGDAGAAKPILEKLPEIMKNNSNRAAFEAAIRASGFSYMSSALVQDLFKNRFCYTQLIQRRKDIQEEKKWSSILGGAL